MKQEYVKVPPRSAIAKALSYSIVRWKKLMVYITNGKLNIDKNPVENSIRPVPTKRLHIIANVQPYIFKLLRTC